MYLYIKTYFLTFYYTKVITYKGEKREETKWPGELNRSTPRVVLVLNFLTPKE